MTSKKLWRLAALLATVAWIAGCGDDQGSVSSTSISVVDEEAGANCVAGGKRIQIFEDNNSNGVLDLDETILSTQYVCNGTEGPQGTGGIATLQTFSMVAPNSTCPEGGQRLESGRDLDANGTLDANEVEATTLVCNGSAGQGIIVISTPEPPGVRCLNGGEQLQIGSDLNDDGMLSEEELQTTEYVCNGGEIVNRVRSLARGGVCPGGGVRFQSGLDFNNDGDLDDNEVDLTEDLCNRYIASIDAAGSHSCAQRSDGAVYCWGQNQLEQLGIPEDELFPELASNVPVPVPGLTGAVRVATGFGHSCAILDNNDRNTRDDDTVKCWGQGDQGQLGQPLADVDGRTADQLAVLYNIAPDGDPPVYEPLIGVTDIALGQFHSCALVADAVYCWGANSHGQVGDNRAGGIVIGEEVEYASQVLVGAGNPLIDVIAISAGDDHSCALKNDSTVWCWGSNTLDQLSDASIASLSSVAVDTGITDASSLVAGDDHTCAITTGGLVLCWGNNEEGQLGADPTATPSSADPITVTIDGTDPLDGINAIGAGINASCGIKLAGDVYCWGLNDEGQLGSPPPAVAPFNSAIALKVGVFDRASDVHVGGAHACAIRDGEAYCWGRNDEGQLGDGSNNTTRYPRRVPLDLAP